MRPAPLCRIVALGGVFFLLTQPVQGQKNSDIENIGQRDINQGSWNLYSLEREITLGRELATEVERTHRLLTDREVVAYVEDLSQRLVRNSDARVPFTVRVIDSDEVNAMALPGGYLYVHTGLLRAAQSEAELAGVLAHEIAHVTARHFVEQASKATILNWLTLPLVFVGGPAAYAAQQALGLAVPLAFLKFSRNAEREADFLGLQYSYKAGYDPVAMIDLLERLKADDSGVPGIFSSHPMTRDRIERSEKTIAGVLPPREAYVVTTSAFERVQARLSRLRGWEALYEIPDRPALVLRRRTEGNY